MFEIGKYYRFKEETVLFYVRDMYTYYIDVGFFKKKKAMRQHFEIIVIDEKSGLSMRHMVHRCTPHELGKLFTQCSEVSYQR